MSETLLSTSNILLFGREVTDLLIAGSDKHTESCVENGDGQDGDGQDGDGQDGDGQGNGGDGGPGDGGPGDGGPGDGGPGDGGPGQGGPGQGRPGPRHDPSQGARRGRAHWLWWQLEEKDARLARIYGFSYEGAYYDLPRPALFLVHGEGTEVTVPARVLPAPPHQSRAPAQPSVGGVAAADFEIADDIRVWSYDKADFTIRMDVETGMFEQVLLDLYFDGGGGVSGARVSGARVSGARVAGARVSGARVSGARVSGARVGGPRGDGSD